MDGRRVSKPNPRCQQPSPAKNLVWNRTLRHGNPNVPEMWNLDHIKAIAESVEVWWTQHTDGTRPLVDPVRQVHQYAGAWHRVGGLGKGHSSRSGELPYCRPGQDGSGTVTMLAAPKWEEYAFDRST